MHWLVYPRRPYTGVRVIPSAEAAEMWKELGYTVEGPFVEGAVEALEAIRAGLADYVRGGQATISPEEIHKLARDVLSRRASG